METLGHETRYILMPGEDEIQLRVGYVIEQLMLARGLSPEEIAVPIRRGPRQVIRLQNGTWWSVQMHDIARIAKALDVKVSEIFEHAEHVTVAHIIQVRGQRLVYAGGSMNPKNPTRPVAPMPNIPPKGPPPKGSPPSPASAPSKPGPKPKAPSAVVTVPTKPKK